MQPDTQQVVEIMLRRINSNSKAGEYARACARVALQTIQAEKLKDRP